MRTSMQVSARNLWRLAQHPGSKVKVCGPGLWVLGLGLGWRAGVKVCVQGSEATTGFGREGGLFFRALASPRNLIGTCGTSERSALITAIS